MTIATSMFAPFNSSVHGTLKTWSLEITATALPIIECSDGESIWLPMPGGHNLRGTPSGRLPAEGCGPRKSLTDDEAV